MSETLLVCKECGVEHGFECFQASPTFLQKLFRVQMVTTYRLRAHAKPMIDPTSDLPAANIIADGWANVSGIEEVPIAELSCMHCRQKGVLIDEWPEGGGVCPNCSDSMIYPSGTRWMT